MVRIKYRTAVYIHHRQCTYTIIVAIHISSKKAVIVRKSKLLFNVSFCYRGFCI